MHPEACYTRRHQRPYRHNRFPRWRVILRVSRRPRHSRATPPEKVDSVSPDQDYVIGPQDLLTINVWHETRAFPIRSRAADGKISLPLVGDLEVSGLTPRLLQARLAQELDAYIANRRSP